MNPMFISSKTRMLTKQAFIVLFCLDLVSSLSLGSLSRILQQEMQQDAMDYYWPSRKLELEGVNVLKKRCEGPACLSKHLASKAGHAERNNVFSSFISFCLRNPACDPGKRRKRSLTQVASLRVTPQRYTV